ncbi:MAG: MFS transporter [Victivallales bacterium]|nr:MFS transporter [Victivallales bacterium]
MIKKFQETFKPNVGAGNFFLSILVWGIATGCFAAVLNNYLSDVRHIDEMERGILEFFREMPGLLLVFIIAIMHKYTDWKILKVGTLVSMIGLAGLMFASDKILITALIMVWSAGEHIILPIRSSIAMHVAREGKLGRSLGMVTGAANAGSVTGSAIAALIFYLGTCHWTVSNELTLYNLSWGLILALLVASLIVICTAKADEAKTKRPRLYFHRKYLKFYALELFYGARKQIFLTFAPYVLIRIYGMDTKNMAVLLGVCALVNIYFAPMIGKLTDYIGYKNVMIYDTVILFFVCLIYGYADSLFAKQIAMWVVCLNFMLDAIISTSSMATNIYVRDISVNEEEITASLTTGISINHLISILAALLGGIVWKYVGVGWLFTFAAIMALGNSAFAMTIPAPKKVAST